MNITAKEYQRRFAKTSKSTRTNDLTKAIIQYLSTNQWKVWRQNNHGVLSHKNAAKNIMAIVPFLKGRNRNDEEALKAIIKAISKSYIKNRMHLKGVSDIIGFHKRSGQWISVEVKTGKDKQSLDQIAFGREVRRSGGVHIIAKDIDQFFESYNQQINLKSQKL